MGLSVNDGRVILGSEGWNMLLRRLKLEIGEWDLNL